MTPSFDVITTADFRPESALRFEALALFFLGSWLQSPGAARRRLPLHLACIHEPPRSVRLLAKRCGASVTIHEPLIISEGAYSNKLRGLEITGKEERFLLLDADVMILGDLRPLSKLKYCIAAAAAGKARVEDHHWPRIYGAVGMTMPTSRMEPQLCLGRTSRTQEELSSKKARTMPPYFNGGVVFAPWACNLGAIWRSHLKSIYLSFAAERNAGLAILESDQAALATAVVKLHRGGTPFRDLPIAYNAHCNLVRVGVLRMEDVICLHCIGLLRDFTAPDQLIPLTAAYVARVEGAAAMKKHAPSLWRVLINRLKGSGQLSRQKVLHLESVREQHVSPAMARAGRCMIV